MLDRAGAKRPVVLGCVLAAVGFALWAGKVTTLSFGHQQWYVVLAGAGMGFMLGPASTDAVNRASRLSYGEATGITQTVRNYAASLGLAILGTLLVTEMRSHADHVARGPGHGPVGGRRPRRPGWPRAGRGCVSRVPSRTSSGSTSPTPPAASSTAWPSSWPPPRWWRWSACAGGPRRSSAVTPRFGRADRRERTPCRPGRTTGTCPTGRRDRQIGLTGGSE